MSRSPPICGFWITVVKALATFVLIMGIGILFRGFCHDYDYFGTKLDEFQDKIGYDAYESKVQSSLTPIPGPALGNEIEDHLRNELGLMFKDIMKPSSFVFLCLVQDWDWLVASLDVVLEGFIREFSGTEDVFLVILPHLQSDSQSSQPQSTNLPHEFYPMRVYHRLSILTMHLSKQDDFRPKTWPRVYVPAALMQYGSGNVLNYMFGLNNFIDAAICVARSQEWSLSCISTIFGYSNVRTLVPESHILENMRNVQSVIPVPDNPIPEGSICVGELFEKQTCNFKAFDRCTVVNMSEMRVTMRKLARTGIDNDHVGKMSYLPHSSAKSSFHSQDQCQRSRDIQIAAMVLMPFDVDEDISIQSLRECVDSFRNSSLTATAGDLSTQIYIVTNYTNSGGSDLDFDKFGGSDYDVHIEKTRDGISWVDVLNRLQLDAKIIVVLPYDCVVAPKWVQTITKIFVEQEDVGIIGSKVIDRGERLLHAGIEYHSGCFLESNNNQPLPFLRLRGMHAMHINSQKFQIMESVSHMGVAFRGDLFLHLGGFRDFMSDSFNVLATPEMFDFCLRSPLKTLYCPNCIVERSLESHSVSSTGLLTTDGISPVSWLSFFAVWHTHLMDRIQGSYDDAPSLYFSAPLSTPSGFANEGLTYVLALEGRLPLKIHDWGGEFGIQNVGLVQCEQERMIRLRDYILDLRDAVYLELWTPEQYQRPVGTLKGIGRHMFETDRVPEKWIAMMNDDTVDEIWVPSQFNAATFEQSGVNSSKIFRIPQCVDVDFFNPSQVTPMQLLSQGGSRIENMDSPCPVKFLSVFEWTDRKDWTTLIEAFIHEFGPHSGSSGEACLFIKTHLPSIFGEDYTDVIYKFVDDFILSLGTSVSATDANIVVLGNVIRQQDMPSLYKAVDCFVLPSHGEGWGRPYMEAMSMELPVIATGWSGNLEFMNERNSILLDYDIVNVTSHKEDTSYIGHYWAQAKLSSLREAMRRVADDPNRMRHLGLNARKDVVERFSQPVVADQIIARLASVAPKTKTRVPRNVTISVIIAFTNTTRMLLLMDSLYTSWSTGTGGLSIEGEVLLVEAGSHDRMKENDIDKYRTRMYVKHYRSTMSNYAAAFDLGVLHAGGEYSVFLTDEVIVDSVNWDSLKSRLHTQTDSGQSAIGAVLLRSGSESGSRLGEIVTAGFDFRIAGAGDVVIASQLAGQSAIHGYDTDATALHYLGLAIATKSLRRVASFSCDGTGCPVYNGVDLCLRLAQNGFIKRFVVSSDLVLQLLVDSDSVLPGGGGDCYHVFTGRWSKYVHKHILHPRLLIRRPVLYSAPFSTPSGYASEAVSFALELEGKIPIVIEDQDLVYGDSDGIAKFPYPKWIMEPLLRMQGRSDLDLSKAIRITHSVAVKFECEPGKQAYCIGRTMFETDRIPSGRGNDWVSACNHMDEVWIPSRFNKRTFANAGVNESELVIVPEGIDVDLFDPSVTEPLDLPSLSRGLKERVSPRANEYRYKFLSLFEFTDRKGCALLIKAFVNEFSSKDNVVLYLKTHTTKGTLRDDTIDFSSSQLQPKKLVEKLCKEFGIGGGRDVEDLPTIEVISNRLDMVQMPSLYKAVDCFVLPSHGEGWGRPYMEAMSMELPVIATGWSGNLEFMNDRNSILLDYDIVNVTRNHMIHEQYLGHKWASARVDDLQKNMRFLSMNPESGKEIGIAARKDIVNHWSQRKVTACHFMNRLREIDLTLK